MSNGPMLIRFDTYYGGAPLEWFYGGLRILSPDPKAGTGFQLTYETGQDATQASANGVTLNPIARADSPLSIQLYNYYCRESLPENWPLAADFYRVTGFAPFFWASHEAIDDALPPHSSGAAQTNWLTKYNPGGKSDYSGPGVPIYFRATSAQSSGIILVGNEMISPSLPWSHRLAEVPSGRVALRIRLSMAETGPGAIAGVLFRREVPTTAATMDQAYNAAGYSLNINYEGTVELIHQAGTPTVLVRTNLNAGSLNNLRGSTGISLELRTYNFNQGLMDIFVDRQPLAHVEEAHPTLGPHVGLLAIAPANTTIRFFDREVFDVGVEFESTIRGLSNGIIESDMIVRPAAGAVATHPFYRMNTVAFLSSAPSFLQRVAVEEPRAQVLDYSDAGSFLVPILDDGDFGLWAGESNGATGLYCVPADATIDGVKAPGPHALIQSHNQPGALHIGSFIHLNALRTNDNTTPQMASTIRLRAFWAGNFMQDIPSAHPQIQVPPRALRIASGSVATFSVTADGCQPMNYKWYKDTALISSATNSQFSLPSAQTADAGNYFVLVSNKAGSVASPAVSLLLTNVPPQLSQLSRDTNGLISFQIEGANSLSYAIESSTDLATWTQVGTVALQAGTGTFAFHPATAAPRLFFRAVGIVPEK